MTGDVGHELLGEDRVGEPAEHDHEHDEADAGRTDAETSEEAAAAAGVDGGELGGTCTLQ